MQLCRGEGLDQHQGAGLECFEQPLMHLSADGCWQVHEHQHQRIKRLGRHLPLGQIGQLGVQLHATLRGERAGFVQAHAGVVHRCHFMALLREPDTVASLAIAGH